MAKRRDTDEPAAATDALRTGFAADYPPSARLDELLTGFRAGDYRRARKDAAKLATEAKDPRVRRAARDLRARLDPGGLATYLFLLPVGLLLILVAHYLFGSH